MSGFAEFDRYDGLGLAELVRRRAVSAEEIVDETLARIEARNPAINAVVTRMDDQARAALRAGLADGPFTGVPYLLKEIGRGKAELVPNTPPGAGDTHPGKRSNPAPGQPDGAPDPYDYKARR